MNQSYQNTLGSERTVEIIFIEEAIRKYCQPGSSLLDIGGVPTTTEQMTGVYNCINSLSLKYDVSDFRHCKYQGDFVQIDFGQTTFDTCMFLSSLEHFPQCTESDLTFRDNYDRKGYEKALSILNDKGYIFLTVPFGKHVWQPYHQNYNWQGILDLTKGSTIVESFTYRLIDNVWTLSDPNTMEDILYTDRAYGVGCFILQKD